MTDVMLGPSPVGLGPACYARRATALASSLPLEKGCCQDFLFSHSCVPCWQPCKLTICCALCHMSPSSYPLVQSPRVNCHYHHKIMASSENNSASATPSKNKEKNEGRRFHVTSSSRDESSFPHPPTLVNYLAFQLCKPALCLWGG